MKLVSIFSPTVKPALEGGMVPSKGAWVGAQNRLVTRKDYVIQSGQVGYFSGFFQHKITNLCLQASKLNFSCLCAMQHQHFQSSHLI